MAVLTLTDAHLAYGHVPLLDGAALRARSRRAHRPDRPQRRGKSSLLKVLAGLEKLDDGLLQAQQGLRIVYVPQEPVFDAGATRVRRRSSEGVAEAKALRARYEAHAEGDDLDALQTRIEALGGWTWEQRVETTLHRLALRRRRARRHAVGRH